MPMRFLWFIAVVLIAVTSPISNSKALQKKAVEPKRPPQLVRTTLRHELRRLPYGGKLTILGAPEGSLSIEGWSRNEVSVSAEIQIRGDSEQDLDRIAAVTGFLIDEDLNHIRIVSTGTHDKAFMRAVAKNFPKTLLGLPSKIDYKIRVPLLCDVEINAGRGPIHINGVEGDVRLSAAESETQLNLSGGALSATVAIGKVNLNVPTRSWRRGGVDIRVAAGEVTVELPSGFSGDIDAGILRSGQIVDTYGGLAARENSGLTSTRMKARAGAGGAFLQFTVGDGVINIKKRE